MKLESLFRTPPVKKKRKKLIATFNIPFVFLFFYLFLFSLLSFVMSIQSFSSFRECGT